MKRVIVAVVAPFAIFAVAVALYFVLLIATWRELWKAP
jgi:hypothetical protein